MKKNLLSFSIVLCLCTISYAQTPALVQTLQKRCSSFEYYQQMLKDDPQFASNQQKIEAFTQEFIKKGGASVTSKGAAVIYTIPVVVHVVYNTPAQNISTAQIQSQVDVLNKDYQKLNSDVTKVPSVWTSLVANVQVSFCLATRYQGSATTGIVRKNTTKTSFSTNNDVKFSSRGGDNAWDATKYLNLWVCPLSGGVLGYAQFPGGALATDGVVIDPKAFGTTGTAAFPYNTGRTATHEIGHWFNLRHIWGDDGSGCSGSDKVTDTPNQADEHYGCPKFPQLSCSNGPNGDMFMNYMDYSDDRCMYMFTKGQKSRMTATLVTGGFRHSVTVSGKCGSQPQTKNSGIEVNLSKLKVVPNPIASSDIPTFFYTLKKSASNIQVSVYNMYGAEIKSLHLGNQASGDYHYSPAELNRMVNGVYIVKLFANNELIGSSRFVVSR
ncbi:MAG: M43 family zinc metalloprotease [Parafilimonas sp.]